MGRSEFEVQPQTGHADRAAVLTQGVGEELPELGASDAIDHLLNRPSLTAS